MLRCPKCGTDNMLTAIFCRGCGERLNLDEIRPDDFANVGPKKQDNTKQNIIGGAIIAGLAVLFLIDWMFPACGKISTTEQDLADAKAQAVAFLTAQPVSLDEKQVSALINEKMGEDGTPCTVRFLGEGKCKAIFSTKIWGMPVNVVVTHPISVSNNKITVEPSAEGEEKSYRLGLGLIPMFESLRTEDPMVSIWSSYSSAWGAIPVTDVKIEDGKITITGQAPPAPKKKKKSGASGAAPAPPAP